MTEISAPSTIHYEDAHRVKVRDGRIEDLDAEEAFDLVWLPVDFLGPDLLPAALTTVHRALRPGGYLVNAALGSAGDEQRAVAARLRARRPPIG